MVGTEAALHRVTRAEVVAFLDIDQHLLAPRFGAGEETLALLARAARLVGTRGSGGRVLVQTRMPDHEVLAAAVHADPALLADPERELRLSLGLPPFGALALLRGPGAAAFAEGLRALERRDGVVGGCRPVAGPGRRPHGPVRRPGRRAPPGRAAAGGGGSHRRLMPPVGTDAAAIAHRVRPRTMWAMSSYAVRVYGDPVLKQVARDVEQFDGALVRLVDDMVETMYDSEGAGLAAPQVGVQKRLFVYDVGDGPEAMVNPTIVEVGGEWYYDEGCLSIPGLRLGIVRPNEVHLRGYGLDGEEVSIEADEFLGRVFQHEVDHLDGVLMVERLEEDIRKLALRVLRDRSLGLDTSAMEAKLVSAGSEREV